jgi:hypothetical protein
MATYGFVLASGQYSSQGLDQAGSLVPAGTVGWTLNRLVSAISVPCTVLKGAMGTRPHQAVACPSAYLSAVKSPDDFPNTVNK